MDFRWNSSEDQRIFYSIKLTKGKLSALTADRVSLTLNGAERVGGVS